MNQANKATKYRQLGDAFFIHQDLKPLYLDVYVSIIIGYLSPHYISTEAKKIFKEVNHASNLN